MFIGHQARAGTLSRTYSPTTGTGLASWVAAQHLPHFFSLTRLLLHFTNSFSRNTDVFLIQQHPSSLFISTMDWYVAHTILNEGAVSPSSWCELCYLSCFDSYSYLSCFDSYNRAREIVFNLYSCWRVYLYYMAMISSSSKNSGSSKNSSSRSLLPPRRKKGGLPPSKLYATSRSEREER